MTPWAMEPLGLIHLQEELSELGPPESASGAGPRVQADLALRLEGRTAVIEVRGTLTRRPEWWSRHRGATSYQEVSSLIVAAESSPEVSEILLVIESPGGESDGLVELAAQVRGTRKRVRAHIEALGASAAYWLASQADTVTASPHARVGSIGTYIPIWDTSARAEKAGIKVHVVRSGEHKGAGSFGDLVSVGQLSAFQETVDQITSGFVADVARGRGLPVEEVAALANGRVWLAERAVDLGLIDGVATRTQALAGHQPKKRRPNMARTSMSSTPAISEAERRTPAISEAERRAIVARERRRLSGLAQEVGHCPDLWEDAVNSGAQPEHSPAAYESAPPVAPARRDFMDSARTRAAAEGTSLRSAMSSLAKADPDLYREHVSAAGSRAVQPAEGQDFMSCSRARAKAEGITLSKAMSVVAREQPELYEAHRTAPPIGRSRR